MRLTRIQLYAWAWTEPLSAIAEVVSWSDVGIRKVCKRHDIPTPARGYWRRAEVGLKVVATPLTNPGDDGATEIVVEDPAVIERVEIAYQSMRGALAKAQERSTTTGLAQASLAPCAHQNAFMGREPSEASEVSVDDPPGADQIAHLLPGAKSLIEMTTRQLRHDEVLAFLDRLEAHATSLTSEPGVQAIMQLWIQKAHKAIVGLDPIAEITASCRQISAGRKSPQWFTPGSRCGRS